MTRNQKKYAIVMILGILLNELCYKAAAYFELPMWLDMTGTALASFVLEPAAGLLVGLANNFILSAFEYDASSLIFYSLSAATALLVGLNLKKDGKICFKKIPFIMIAVVVATTVLGGGITLWHGGVPDSVIEQSYYYSFIKNGMPDYLATFLSVGVIKVYDVIGSTVVVGISYLLLPKTWKCGYKE